MRNRITKRFAMLAILCVLIMALAAPALAASYSKVYGQTQDRIRVRASASSSGTIIDNIVKGACVYITDSKTSSGNTYLKVNYRNSDGDVSSGWVRQKDGNETYVKILSAEQAQSLFSVKSGNLPAKKVGTFTAAERKAADSSSSSSSSSDSNTIKSVQTMLKALKYYSGDITGNVGEKTKAAIKQFQKEYDLTADGVAGPLTIAKLESVYNDKGGSSVSTSSSSSGSGLRLGSTGTKVRDLQQDLTTLGYYWADITGSFGSKTEAAVKNFQEKNNLSADGVAGTKTLNAIASAIDRKGGSSSSDSSYTSGTTLKLDSKGTAVTQLQTDLKQLGYYYADITGSFGEKTEAAVKDFQKAKDLNADGVAGSKTLDAISKAIAAAGGSSSSSSGGLKVGSTGDKVRQLQQDLTALGYYYGDVSGHYGNLTKTAVSKFQKAKGIAQDGIAGTTTLNAVAKALGGSSSSSSSALREGDESSAVLELQTMLKELGYYYGDMTGSFGTLTKRAVRQFQDDNDLTVDGIAGTKTLNLLRTQTGSASSDSVSTGSVTSSSVAEKDSYFEINQDGVRLRATYSLTAAAKTTMNEGKAVKATRKYIVAGTTWYYITVKNSSGTHQGYVRAKVLDPITKAEYDGSGDSVSNAGNAEILGMIRITADNVAIRESSSTSSTAMGHANKGDVFFYMDKAGSWYQIQSGYWIKDTYAEVLEEDEVEDYFDSGSYAGGTYRLGDRGAMVLWIQEALTDLGYYKNDLSGHYGDKTKEAVRKFQKDHSLSADGVAGPKTIAKLMEEVNEDTSSSGTTAADKTKTVFNISWSKMKDEKLITTNLTLTDIKTGLSFDVKVQSTGNHADVEPKTANDTKVLCTLYGAANAAQLESENMYQRRTMIVTNSAGQQFIGSIYAIPHGNDTVSGNNFDGQFCLHFKDSTVHDGGGSINESENHQAKIKQAAKDLKDKGYNVSETYP